MSSARAQGKQLWPPEGGWGDGEGGERGRRGRVGRGSRGGWGEGEH